MKHAASLFAPDADFVNEIPYNLCATWLVAVGAVARLCVHRRAEHHDGGVADPLELGAGDPRTADVTREKQAVATGRVDRHLTTAHRATTPFHTADFI